MVRFACISLIVAGVVESLIGIGLVTIFALGGPNYGLQFDSLTGVYNPYGTQWEGNTFGSFIGSALVMLTALLVTGHAATRRWTIAAASVMVVGLALSLSRGAWIGTGLALCAILFLNGGRSRALVALAVPLVLGSFLMLQNLTPVDDDASAASAALRRFALIEGGLLRGQVDVTTNERLYLYERAIESWLEHPIEGVGTGSFGQTTNFLTIEAPGWIGNLELHALHDSGLIGVTLLMACLGLLTYRLMRRSTRRAGGVSASPWALPMLGAVVALGVSFQATEATWLGYSWYIFGLAAAVADEEKL